MRLLDDLTAIVRQLETDLEVKLTDEHFADGRDEIVHIFLHEACYAAVAHCAPWIHDLPNQEHTALDEVLARLLEGTIGARLDIEGHTAAEHVHELTLYPVPITLGHWAHLQTRWEQDYWPGRDVTGMARYALTYSREKGVVGAGM